MKTIDVSEKCNYKYKIRVIMFDCYKNNTFVNVLVFVRDHN